MSAKGYFILAVMTIIYLGSILFVSNDAKSLKKQCYKLESKNDLLKTACNDMLIKYREFNFAMSRDTNVRFNVSTEDSYKKFNESIFNIYDIINY